MTPAAGEMPGGTVVLHARRFGRWRDLTDAESEEGE